VQVVESQTAPGRAQNAKPGHAVVRIEQSATQRQCVEDFGAVFQFFEIEGAEGNRRLMQRLRDGHERVARAGKHGDAVLLAGFSSLVHRRLMALDKFNDLGDLLGLQVASARGLLIASLFLMSCLWRKIEMQLEVSPRRIKVLASRLGLKEIHAAAIVQRKYLLEDRVQLPHQRRRGTEVRGERNEVEWERFAIRDFEANLLYAGEEFRIRVAEKIDGLHGVADGEASAPRAVWPGGDEAGEQLMLAAAGVLEFIDEQVPYTVGNGHGGFGGKAVVGLQHALGDLGNLDEIDRCGLSENHLELARRMA
jgi:hypothetical protein